ncbi:hypothetical protein MAHJHV54_43410 [Mycobacterium avium subsp. hominissuis]
MPAPRNSALHRSAALHREAGRRAPAAEPPARHPTRHLTRGPEEWPQPEPPAHVGAEPDDDEDDYEYQPVTGEFAGIPISEFVWARQHNRRMVLVWLALVLAVTGMVATAAWTIGRNLNGLF